VAPREIVELREEIRRLGAALEETRQALKALEMRAPPPPADAIFTIRRGRFSLQLAGWLQVDAVLWDQSSVDELTPGGEPLNETRFVLRRGRLALSVDYRFLEAALQLDANTVNGPTVRILTAWVGFRWPPAERGNPPYVAVRLGLQRIPFGGELREPARDRLFLERASVITALFPSAWDLGVAVLGGWRFLRYHLAAMNGSPIDAAQFQARDPSQQKDFVGRLGVDARPHRKVLLLGGFSGLYGQGFHPGTPSRKDVLVWRDIDENGIVGLPEIQVIPGQAGAPSASFERYAVAGDLRLIATLPRLGELMVYGEVVWAANLDRGLQPSDPVAAGRTLRQLGWLVGATLELTRWAQVGLRYDGYNPDLDATDPRGFRIVPLDTTFSTVAVAVAGRWTPYGRLVLEYAHRDNALGRTGGGLPTTLGTDSLILRGQVQF
jgi:hypothetical protein